MTVRATVEKDGAGKPAFTKHKRLSLTTPSASGSFIFHFTRVNATSNLLSLTTVVKGNYFFDHYKSYTLHLKGIHFFELQVTQDD